MKKTILKVTSKLFLLILIFANVVSCSKDDDNNVNGNGSISLKVDGIAWDATLAVQGVYASNLFTITGSDSNGKQASLTVMNPEAGKTFNTGGLANYTIMGRWTAGLDASQTYSTAAVMSVSGEIKFTKFTDSHAEGTFYFKARNTSQQEVDITDGKFSVNF